MYYSLASATYPVDTRTSTRKTRMFEQFGLVHKQPLTLRYSICFWHEDCNKKTKASHHAAGASCPGGNKSMVQNEAQLSYVASQMLNKSASRCTSKTFSGGARVPVG